MTSMSPAASPAPSPLSLEFDDNRLMTALCGAHDEHLARLEQRLGVSVHARGNRLTISGSDDGAESARRAITLLYDRLKAGHDVDRAEVDAAVRMAQGSDAPPPGARSGADLVITTPKRVVAARSPGQEVYIRALQEAELVFGLGPAGTGKTYLAVAHAA
ncbi:MAG: PhoH family protein, partial [Bauldia litoralis]